MIVRIVMSLLTLLGILGLTLFLQGWLHKHIQGLALALTRDPGCAIRALFLLLLPGVLLHEGSHWLMAHLLRVPTGPIHVGLVPDRGKMMSLGSVNVARTDPLRESLIGAAPFVVGLGTILLLAGYGLHLWPGANLSPEQVLDRLVLALADWRAWIFVYLIFAVSTAMVPSESDRQPWGPLLLVVGVLVVTAVLMGWSPKVTPEMLQWGRRALNALDVALGVTVLVNGAVAVVLWAAEQTLTSVTQRQTIGHR